MDILDRLAELIQEGTKKGDGRIINDCDIRWSARTYEEQQKLLAEIKKFEIRGVEIAVVGDTLHIRPKTT